MQEKLILFLDPTELNHILLLVLLVFQLDFTFCLGFVHLQIFQIYLQINILALFLVE